ncbi:MAG: hypothetical protein EAY81_04170 [Bacteroidetes bacterium]|nr:MAG: hypothetical protein EAY81_04170 [Bacteroidota bacterium]
MSACHYGQDEAKQTLERNEKYKTEKAEYSINRAGEYGNPNNTQKPDTMVAKPANDTTSVK